MTQIATAAGRRARPDGTRWAPAARRARGASDLAPCRTTRRGGWSTTPTPTSWRPRRGCGITPTRPFGIASSRLRYPGGNELRQTGDPAEQQRDLGAAFERLAARHHAGATYREVEAEEIMLRKNFAATGGVHRRRPSPGPRPARLLQPARLQHLPQPAAARLGARERPGAGHRCRPGPQPRHGRVLLGRPPAAGDLLRAAGRPRPGARARGRGHRAGSRRAAHRVGLPARPLTQPRRPRPGLGAGAGGRDPGRVPRRRHGRPHRSGVLPQRPARSRRTSTAARRTSAPSTTWASPVRRRRPWRR